MSDDNTYYGDQFKGAGSHIKYLIAELISILLATALKILDVDEGHKRLVELMTSGFKAKYGAAMRELELHIARLQAELILVEDERKRVLDDLKHTPKWLSTSKINHGRSDDDHVETTWRDWQGRHKVESLLLALLIPLAATASLLTAKANMEGTGLEIFQTGPLVWTMAALAPLSGFAIKTMWSHLRREWARKVFTIGLNTLTVIFIFAWVLLYATSYKGMDAGAAMAGLFDDQIWWDQTLPMAFTVMTLLTEISVTSVLAHRLDKLAAYYSPFYWLENPDFLDLMACQDLNDIERVYSKHDLETVLSETHIKQFLAVRSKTTLDWLSGYLGDYTETISSYSMGRDGPQESLARASRKLLTSDELQRLPDRAQIILYGNLKPVLALKSQVFAIAPWRKTVRINSSYGSKRKLSPVEIRLRWWRTEVTPRARRAYARMMRAVFRDRGQKGRFWMHIFGGLHPGLCLAIGLILPVRIPCPVGMGATRLSVVLGMIGWRAEVKMTRCSGTARLRNTAPWRVRFPIICRGAT
jgi:hypothetical protein